MRLTMQPYDPGNGVLAGAIDGQKAFLSLVQETPAVGKPEVCFLDFAGIDVATTSFLRESIVAYRNHARSSWQNIYPVAANLAPRVREELEAFLFSRGDAFVICELDRNEQPKDVQLIGQLDGKQLFALTAVLKMGQTDAPTLAAQFNAHEQVTPTAWNNRLVALAAKGILVEVSSGRSKKYRPVLEGLKYGT
jgi:hypothetical protein